MLTKTNYINCYIPKEPTKTNDVILIYSFIFSGDFVTLFIDYKDKNNFRITFDKKSILYFRTYIDNGVSKNYKNKFSLTFYNGESMELNFPENVYVKIPKDPSYPDGEEFYTVDDPDNVRLKVHELFLKWYLTRKE